MDTIISKLCYNKNYSSSKLKKLATEGIDIINTILRLKRPTPYILSDDNNTIHISYEDSLLLAYNILITIQQYIHILNIDKYTVPSTLISLCERTNKYFYLFYNTLQDNINNNNINNNNINNNNIDIIIANELLKRRINKKVNINEINKILHRSSKKDKILRILNKIKYKDNNKGSINNKCNIINNNNNINNIINNKCNINNITTYNININNININNIIDNINNNITTINNKDNNNNINNIIDNRWNINNNKYLIKNKKLSVREYKILLKENINNNDIYYIYDIIAYIYLLAADYFNSMYYLNKIIDNINNKDNIIIFNTINKIILIERMSNKKTVCPTVHLDNNILKYKSILIDNYIIRYNNIKEVLRVLSLLSCYKDNNNKGSINNIIDNNKGSIYNNNNIIHTYNNINNINNNNIIHTYNNNNIFILKIIDNILQIENNIINIKVDIEEEIISFNRIMKNNKEVLSMKEESIEFKRWWWKERERMDRELKNIIDNINNKIIYNNNIISNNNNIIDNIIVILSDELLNFPVEELIIFNNKNVYRLSSIEYYYNNINIINNNIRNINNNINIIDNNISKGSIIDNNISKGSIIDNINIIDNNINTIDNNINIIDNKRIKKVITVYDNSENIRESKKRMEELLLNSKLKDIIDYNYKRIIDDRSEDNIILYFGHGNGEGLLGFYTHPLKNNCYFLFGCSSVFYNCATNFRSNSIVDFYLRDNNRIIGCMWDVTDRDIDIISTNIIRDIHNTSNIAQLVYKAKRTCRLRYLNGSAVVVYGLPLNLTIVL